MKIENAEKTEKKSVEKTQTQKIIEQLQLKIGKAQTRVDALRERLGEDAFEALTWLHDAIGAAADLRVLPSVVASLEKGISARHVLLCANDSAHRLAAHGSRRSSGAVCAPLQAEELRAWTEVVDLLREFTSADEATP